METGWHAITMDEAVAKARAAGYRWTQHGTLQRGLWHAVKVEPAPGGVMVRRAWTTAQIITVGVFLVLLFIGTVGAPQ